jgi:DHA1 family tetracycline resistance protein-like MFS transporter
MAGLAFGVLGFVVLGLATTSFVFCFGIPLTALWGLAGPASQGLMSRRVSASEQGQLQGANNSLRGIAGMLGPGMFTLTFAAFIGTQRDWHLPGAPFFLAAVLLTGSGLLAWRVTRQAIRDENAA